MKNTGKPLMLGASLVVLLMLVGVARARAVQEWYHTVTVQGRVTMWLLDDRARIDGALIEGGSQIRFSPRVAEAVVARAHVGDTVSVVGRGGRASSFGRVVQAREITVNGQTFTTFDEPHPPPPPPRGPHGPGRAEVPPPPPPHDGRGPVAPPAPVAADAPIPPPPPSGAVTPPAPLPPPAAAADSGAPNRPVSPAGADAPRVPDAPPPPPSHSVTARGTVQAFLVGERGEVVGLALDTGEQVRFSPRIGEALTARPIDAHPAVVVEGDAVQSDRGTVVRPTQVTVGARTLIVP